MAFKDQCIISIEAGAVPDFGLALIKATAVEVSSTKVVQVIKCTCTVFIDNFRNISTNLSIEVSVCRGSYDRYVKHKRNDPISDPWDCQGNEKCNFYFYCLLP